METPNQPEVAMTFGDTGLSQPILHALNRANLLVPTPIQAKAIPVALTGADVMGIAQTGTGKTLAFSLPILERLMSAPGTALVLAPTRELAIQIEESARRVIHGLPHGIRTTCLIGGASMFNQIQHLKARPRLIIATPGRLVDHLERRTINLSDVAILVLDEADRMLDMGFAPQLKRILEHVPAVRQTMLFSATMAPEVEALTHGYMTEPQKVEVAVAGSNNHLIHQQICYVVKEAKIELLIKILKETTGTTLVFSRTKHGASKLNNRLRDSGFRSTEIHSNRSLAQRRQALDGFKSGRFQILVATDVAARGIDVQNIGLVINFDLPDATEDYVHRIGRTGRNGQQGEAISFATPDQARDVKAIERLTGKTLEVSRFSDPAPVVHAHEGLHHHHRDRGNHSRHDGRRQHGEHRSSFSGRPGGHKKPRGQMFFGQISSNR